MLNLSIWAFIADAYTPLLVVFSLFTLVKQPNQSTFKSSIGLLLSVCFIYGLMWLDKTLEIWSQFELDYSTHTALALVFVVFLSLNSIKTLLFSALSILLYAALMMTLQYHTLLDILTTALAVTPVVWWLQRTFIIKINEHNH